MTAPVTAASDAQRLPPASLRVRLQHDVLIRDGGRLLAGGTPYRLTRLTPAGAQVAAGWRAPSAVGPGHASRALARRLLDAGMLVTVPEAEPSAGRLAVVVPVHGRPDDLDRCLRSITNAAPGVPVLVVDDASPDPTAIEAVTGRHGARIVRHASCRGPAAARNTGCASTDRPLIAFVDSDVTIGRGCLDRLVGHFADPRVGAAAPRVHASIAPGAQGPLASYEARHSSLDMGPVEASVGPGTRVPYVPSTTLVIRRTALPTGFDEAMRVGEDVDLVWRMHAAGWRVAYDPAATIHHTHRTRPGAFARRRFDYATSTGALARRHPRALPAITADLASLAALGFLALGRPRSAATIVALRMVRLRRQLIGRTEHPTVLAGDLVLRGTLSAVRAGAHAVRRPWAPVLLLAAAWSPRRALGALAVAHGVRMLESGRPSPRHLPIAIADDLIAGLGTWVGCLRERTARPLLPRIAWHTKPAGR